MHRSMILKVEQLYLFDYLKVTYCFNLNYKEELLSILGSLIFIMFEVPNILKKDFQRISDLLNKIVI